MSCVLHGLHADERMRALYKTSASQQFKLTRGKLCSVIIRICGEGGYWDQAELLFKEQLKAADTDINCQPNAISYRSGLTRRSKGLLSP